MMSAGRAFCCFTRAAIRQGHVGVGDTPLDESGRVDEWMGMNMGTEKEDRSGERELEERRGEIKGRNRGRNVDGKFCLCSSAGGLYHSNALSEESSRDKRRWGEERVGTRVRETQEGI